MYLYIMFIEGEVNMECYRQCNSRHHFSFTVLSIHKRPVVGHADISFPMKGWRGMVDWARSSEDRVTIPKNILSTGQPGNNGPLQRQVYHHLRTKRCIIPFLQSWVWQKAEPLAFAFESMSFKDFSFVPNYNTETSYKWTLLNVWYSNKCKMFLQILIKVDLFALNVYSICLCVAERGLARWKSRNKERQLFYKTVFAVINVQGKVPAQRNAFWDSWI